ncbi:hypothetical protein MUK42_06087 [Musa troglodytarum]|uniref:Uncharacterized protein n=1 Tax=Musa troglodytarum TaxID=320322 RepID=A0A9E7H0I9_9LILI|nr:hypothetical protein MUK42_06087 [Musa troglodytarum]
MYSITRTVVQVTVRPPCRAVPCRTGPDRTALATLFGWPRGSLPDAHPNPATCREENCLMDSLIFQHKELVQQSRFFQHNSQSQLGEAKEIAEGEPLPEKDTCHLSRGCIARKGSFCKLPGTCVSARNTSFAVGDIITVELSSSDIELDKGATFLELADVDLMLVKQVCNLMPGDRVLRQKQQGRGKEENKQHFREYMEKQRKATKIVSGWRCVRCIRRRKRHGCCLRPTVSAL